MQFFTNPFGSNMSTDQRIGSFLDPAQVFGNKSGSGLLGESANQSQWNQLSNSNGQPQLPGFAGALTDTGVLKSQYTLGTPGQVEYLPSQGLVQGVVDRNSSGLNELQNEALQTNGPSTWEKLANAQADQNLKTAQDNTQQQGGAQTANALSGLASQGGLSSGARERAQLAGSNNTMNNLQGLQSTNLNNKAGNMVQGEGMRQNQLSNLVGAQGNTQNLLANAATGDVNRQTGVEQYNTSNNLAANEFNLQNALGSLNAQNQYNANAYANQAQMYGGNKLAQAQMMGSGGKGGGK